MDQNRLPLHLGGFQNNKQNHENDRTYSANNEGVYPTTPSTFPQPVFQPMHGGQQDYLTAGVRGPTGGAYNAGAQGYFGGTQYPAFNQGTHYVNQPYQANLTSPQPFSPNTLHATDPNSGLANKFSAQNLGNQPRQNQFFGRQPSPLAASSRPNPQQSYSSHLSPLAASSSHSSLSEEKPPEQVPNKYSGNVGKRMISLHLWVEKFFKDNITRARERNVRYVTTIIVVRGQGLIPKQCPRV